MKTYPVENSVRWLKKMFPNMPISEVPVLETNKFLAVATGDYREPKKGELYISGAIPTAYFAPNDLSSKYHIAKLIGIQKTETVTRNIPIPESWKG